MLICLQSNRVVERAVQVPQHGTGCVMEHEDVHKRLSLVYVEVVRGGKLTACGHRMLPADLQFLCVIMTDSGLHTDITGCWIVPHTADRVTCNESISTTFRLVFLICRNRYW